VSPKTSSGSPRKATSCNQVSINDAGTTQIEPPAKSGPMVYVLTQFVSPVGVERFRTIVAMTAAALAFAFLTLIVLGG
jgi:hypothetical protein